MDQIYDIEQAIPYCRQEYYIQGEPEVRFGLRYRLILLDVPNFSLHVWDDRLFSIFLDSWVEDRGGLA